MNLFDQWLEDNYKELLSTYSENFSDPDNFVDWARDEFDEISENLFNDCWDNMRSCSHCEHCFVESDPYGTGDSPESFECNAPDAEDCPYVLDNIGEPYAG